ncbi:MAG: hypothetical protein LBD18_03535 [Treponema sp.]|jgi:hypothetical protein|nr:hypothetical protein [Treponema sp.]
MKKQIGFLLMVMLFITALAFMGCPTEGDDNTDPKSITITGLTGKSGYIAVVFSNGSTIIAQGTGIITNEAVTVALKTGDEAATVWTGFGSYYLQLSLQAEGNSFIHYIYTGGQTLEQLGISSSADYLTKLPKFTIDTASSTVDFSKFLLQPAEEEEFEPGDPVIDENKIVHENPAIEAVVINSDEGTATVNAADGSVTLTGTKNYANVGFTYAFPTGIGIDWKDCATIDIEYVVTINSGTAKVITKDGKGITSNDTDPASYPQLEAGTGKKITLNVPTFAKSIAGEDNIVPGFTFQYGENGISSFTVKVTKITFTYIPPVQDTFGKQPDGTYKLDPCKFESWYSASVAANVISFTGGGVKYLFPVTDTQFSINDYDGMTVEYTTSEGTPAGDNPHLEITIKAITSSFGSDGNYGTDLYYKWLPGANGDNGSLGDNSFTLGPSDGQDGKGFNNFKDTGIVGFAFQANGSATTFKLEIRSIVLNPATGS